MIYLKDEFKTKLQNARDMFEYFIGKASRDVWRCDPKENIESSCLNSRVEGTKVG